jgi:hypothetical protein
LKFSAGLDIYTDFKNQFFSELGNLEKGDPAATPAALFAVVDADNPPLRFNLGKYNLAGLRAVYAERLATWEVWDAVSASAQG